jgi:tripartite-type tricarboxylate transporter receptor subunit TctC
MKTSRLQTVLVALALCVAGGTAVAQEYPNKPVRFVVPYVPGGSTSVISRILAQKFQEQTGQSMVIDNRPGAGSNIGSDLVAKAPSDGYTLLLGTSSLAINTSLYSKMSFDPIKDLAPISSLISAPNVLAVPASLPINSVKDLIDYARANPGRLNYGSSGNGATNHMAMEMLKTMAGVQIQHIPYKGGGDALAGILSGQIQVMFNPASTLVPHEKGGRLRLLAVTSDKRVEGLDLPTVAETLPGFESSVWSGVFAPAGTPKPIVDKVNAVVNSALKDKEMIEVLRRAGMTATGGTIEQMRSTLATDTVRWAAVVKASGAKVD